MRQTKLMGKDFSEVLNLVIIKLNSAVIGGKAITAVLMTERGSAALSKRARLH